MTALLFFRPEGMFYLVNFFPRVLPYFTELAEPSEFFTVIFASGFLLTHALICFGISFRPQDRSLPTILFLAKVATCAAFIYGFLHHQKTFAFIAGAVVEAVIAILVLVRLVRIRTYHPQA